MIVVFGGAWKKRLPSQGFLAITNLVPGVLLRHIATSSSWSCVQVLAQQSKMLHNIIIPAVVEFRNSGCFYILFKLEFRGLFCRKKKCSRIAFSINTSMYNYVHIHPQCSK